MKPSDFDRSQRAYDAEEPSDDDPNEGWIDDDYEPDDDYDEYEADQAANDWERWRDNGRD